MKTTKEEREDLLTKLKSGNPFPLSKEYYVTARNLCNQHGLRARIKRQKDLTFICKGEQKEDKQ
jgi:hypothetical protein